MKSDPIFLWKDENGQPYDYRTSLLIDTILNKLTSKEKYQYDQYALGISKLFNEFNKKYCPHCNYDYWAGRKLKNGKANDRGCCVDCGGNKGYLRKNYFETTVFENLRKIIPFNHNNGFFDPVTMRCSIPRHLRSHTCLHYICSRNVDTRKLSENAGMILEQMELLRHINSQRYIDEKIKGELT